MMNISYVDTMESPCRRCENVHLSKDECIGSCDRLHAFQEAILRSNERNLKDFRNRYGLQREWRVQ